MHTVWTECSAQDWVVQLVHDDASPWSDRTTETILTECPSMRMHYQSAVVALAESELERRLQCPPPITRDWAFDPAELRDITLLNLLWASS